MNGIFLLIPILIFSIAGFVVSRILSSDSDKGYIVQSIFISLPGWTLAIMGFSMVQGYMFRFLGIILFLIAAIFIGGAVTYSVVKYKKAKREEERIRNLWKSE
jgi:flagellar biosynthesis component FlhA